MSDRAPTTAAPSPTSDSGHDSGAGPYHHGNLHEALLDAVGEIIGEKGVGGLSLREAARRAGVSHGAPAHHFGDKLGMLTAYSIRGLELFGQRMRAAAAEVETPNDKIAAIGLAYLRFAMEEPDYFGVMFRSEMHRQDDQPFLDASFSCFDVLSQIATELAAAGELDHPGTIDGAGDGAGELDHPGTIDGAGDGAGDPSSDHASMAVHPKTSTTGKDASQGTVVAIRAWSMVHGLATLWLDGAIANLWDGDDIYELAQRIFETEL